MSIHYTINSDRRLVYVIVDGVVTPGDWFSFRVQLRDNRRYEPGFDHLSDLCNVDFQAVTVLI